MIVLPTTTEEKKPKWLNSPISVFEGSLDKMFEHLPIFERREFGLQPKEDEEIISHTRLDTIVRLPYKEHNHAVPVGVVSKDYNLIQHKDVLDIALKALEAANIKKEDVKAKLTITEYGERMALSIFLPEKYQYDPGDNNPMALRLECINSVDGSTRFRAIMGWFRFVCSNGLVIGVTSTDMHRRHVGDIQLEHVGSVLTSGMKSVEKEQRNFDIWRKSKISPDRINPWIESAVFKTWGFKAATRVFNIARSGSDIEIIGTYKGYTPTSIPVRATQKVPGSEHGCQTLYDVSQILAWLAKERRDFQEQLEWREQIPKLMKPLLN